MDDAFIWSANERHMQAMRRHPTLRNNLPHKGVDIYPNLPLKTEIVDNQSGGTASEVAGRKAPSQLLHSTYSYGRCSSRHGPPQNRGRTHTVRRARFVLEGVFFHSLFFFFCSLFFFCPLGPLVLWSPGPLVPWSSGPVVLWSRGPLVFL